MPNLIISVAFAILSLHFFTVTYRVTGINRTLYNIPISIFEVSIPLLQEDGDFTPFYDKEMLESKLTSYFHSTLHKYTEKYTVEYYYYNQEDFSYCTSSTCDAIEITLTSKIFINFNYQKTARFYIRNNK